MASDDELFDWISLDEVFGDDSFEDFDSTGMVPDSLGIDDGDRASLADSETVCLGSVDSPLLRQIQLLEAALEKLPGFESDFLITTFWFCLVATEEDVSSDSIHAETLCDALQVRVHGSQSLSDLVLGF